MTLLAEDLPTGRHEAPPLASAMARLDFDYLFCTAVFSAALFIRYLPGIAPLLFIAASGLFFFVRPGKLHALGKCYGLLTLGAFTMLSAVWSPVPDQTIYYGLQYALTILLACQISSGVEERKLLLGLFTAFLAFGLANFWDGLTTGGITFSGFYNHYAFVGLMGSKNAQADTAALGTMVALATLIDALRRRNLALALLALGLILIDVLIVANAQSTGAVVGIGIGSAMVIILNTYRILPLQTRIVSFVGIVVIAIIVVATQPIWYEPLLHDVMAVAGKDTTLTGRTYIWERARVAIDRHPILGVGFSGFWIVGNLEAEAIWRRLEIHNRSGFNFHNTYYDIRVHLGLLGVILFAAVCLPAAAKLVMRVIRQPSSVTILFMSLIVYEASRMNFESRGTTAFHYATFLLAAAFAWPNRTLSDPSPGPTLRRRHRRPVRWRGE